MYKCKNMTRCKPFNNFQYRVFENYFGKCNLTTALCDCADIETAERLVNILSEYYKDRPFEFYIGSIIHA